MDDYHNQLEQLFEQFNQGLLTEREYWGKVLELASTAYAASPE